jgi:hypothetical protein
MTTIPELSPQLQALFTTTADKLARSTGFIRRQRQITGSGFAQTLVLGGLSTPEATRRQQHQSAIQAGLQVSPQALEQRFTPQARDFMRELLKNGLTELVCSEEKVALLPQFNGVYVTDCTRLVWGKAGQKLAVRWELQSGQLQAHLGELTTNDQLTPVIDYPMPAGALHLGDLGFFKLSRFEQWSQQGVYWLSRYKVGTTLLYADGRTLDLIQYLQTASLPATLPVKVGRKQRIQAYLVVDRIPHDAHNKRLARLKEQARLDQKQLSKAQQSHAQWTIYLTNIPNLTFNQAHTLARTRWQIELLFKLWKSHGAILRSRSADPIRQQCEGYAKLLGVMVAHWVLLVAGWHPDTIPSLDALRVVRTHLTLLFRGLRHPIFLHYFFDHLRDDLNATYPMTKRRKHPLAFQLWRDFDWCMP